MAGEAPNLSYRADLDGLRALAILLVVGCHVGVPGMEGGFVGVDVFFVISGYLITGLLLAEQRERGGRIDLAGFYARRVRRLLPALGIVVATTLLLGLVVLLPNQQQDLARSALAALAFVANHHAVLTQQDYFSEAATLLPLQHLWTLAVEEQFYLLWPPLLLALGALARRTGLAPTRVVVATLAAIVLASLAASIAFSSRFPAASFFLLHTRAWELGVGGLLALAPVLPVAARRWLAPLGLAAIGAATLWFGEATPFPSWRALLPVLGAAALIASESPLLAARPLVATGKLSYGWYLWHWPLLAIARNYWGSPEIGRDAVVALIALALAAISLRWIETPVRERRAAPFRTSGGALASGAAILAGCAALSGAVWLWASRPPLPGSVLAQYLEARRTTARDFPFCDGTRRASRCEAGAPDGKAAVLLWGDSHAAHLMIGLDRAARDAGLRIVARTKGGCLPGGVASGPAHNAQVRAECGEFNAAVLAALPGLGVRGVILAGEWDARRMGEGLGELVAKLRAMGLRVVLAADVPTQPASFAQCAIRRSPLACAVPRSEADRDAAPVAAIFERTGARIWSPLDAMCPEARCPAAIDGALLYRNRGHLTKAGSARLAPSLGAELAWLTAP